jgi:hypothetical protein
MAQDKIEPTPTASSANAADPKFKSIFREEWAAHKAKNKGAIKGTIRQQFSMAASSRVADFWSLTFDQVRRVRAMRHAPTRVETFEEACARLKLSNDDLAAQFKQFRLAHWLCYGIGIAIFVYAYWLGLNTGLLPAAGAFLFAIGAMVNGYLYGFRAWQIQIRDLAPLTQAVRRLDSYLVV